VLFALPIEKWAAKPAAIAPSASLPALGNRIVIPSALAQSRDSQQA
jgi:hypothetical protein